MNHLTTVDFHGDVLFAGEQDGEVFVAVKPICDALGVVWRKQRSRIHRDTILAEGSTMMVLPSAGGMQETTLLRLDLMNGFLFGIDENRVAPEAREKVLAYKRECFRVLYNHFFGRARRQDQDLLDDPKERAKLAAIERKAIAGYNAMHNFMLHLLAQLSRLTEPAERRVTHQLLQKICAELDVDCPPLDTVGQDRPEMPDDLLSFWEEFLDLGDTDDLNHTAEPGLIALNLPQLREHMSKLTPRIQIDGILKAALKGSRAPHPQFVETTVIRSRHTKEPIRCWVFKV